MWFMIVGILNAGHMDVLPSLSSFRFATHAECMASAAERTKAFHAVNVRGRYLCLYHNEPRAELERTQMVWF